VYPLVITRVWSDNPAETTCVNGQVLLDGNDNLWVTSRSQDTVDVDRLEPITPGRWFAPPRV
jgi:hypothetical protein